MKTCAKKLAAVGFLAFLGLWVAGSLRTFALAEPEFVAFPAPALYSGEDSRAGVKTANNLGQIGLAKAPLPQVLDQEDLHKVQVYEKTAQLSSVTSAFADDEGRMRSAIASEKAAVFNEKRTGVAPHRSLSLGIGVRPERFDALLQELGGVGRVRSISVQQQDRTADFRRLHAQRQSLKKHLQAVLKLREGGRLSVEEALKLEQRVLEAEKEVQAVGVQLGDLLDKEPSCNLLITLQEHPPGAGIDRGFHLAWRLGGGLPWALGWWFTSALVVGLLLGAWGSVKVLRPARS